MSATFMICVHDFFRGEVLMKVGVMEFGLLPLLLPAAAAVVVVQ